MRAAIEQVKIRAVEYFVVALGAVVVSVLAVIENYLVDWFVPMPPQSSSSYSLSFGTVPTYALTTLAGPGSTSRPTFAIAPHAELRRRSCRCATRIAAGGAWSVSNTFPIPRV